MEKYHMQPVTKRELQWLYYCQTKQTFVKKKKVIRIKKKTVF